MNVDVFWVQEDLVQREVPQRVRTGAPHPLLVLPVRRNMLDDGYAFAVRCSSGSSRPHDGTPPRPRLFAFEENIAWESTFVHANNIAMFHNLFPVRKDVLTRLGGRGFLGGEQIASIEALLAGMLWDETIAGVLLPEPHPGKLVPRAVREASPGDIINIDGSQGVVVSNRVLNDRHALGSLAIVPLVNGAGLEGSHRVSVRSLVAAPEFLKLCQPIARIHDVRLSGDRVESGALAFLIAQVRELLEWGEVVQPSFPSDGADAIAIAESEHACLFSTRPRPREGVPPKKIPLPFDRPISYSGGVFEPILLDSTRYEGPAGALRIELWDRQGNVSIQFVAEDGRLPIINLISVLSQDGSINIARGPIWPEDWTFSLPVGALSELQDQPLDVSVRAPGLSVEYTFQLTRTDGASGEDGPT